MKEINEYKNTPENYKNPQQSEETQKTGYTWPTSPEFFSQTNVEAIVRNIPENQRTLGLPAIKEDSRLSIIVNFPALVMKSLD